MNKLVEKSLVIYVIGFLSFLLISSGTIVPHVTSMPVLERVKNFERLSNIKNSDIFSEKNKNSDKNTIKQFCEGTTGKLIDFLHFTSSVFSILLFLFGLITWIPVAFVCIPCSIICGFVSLILLSIALTTFMIMPEICIFFAAAGIVTGVFAVASFLLGVAWPFILFLLG